MKNELKARIQRKIARGSETVDEIFNRLYAQFNRKASDRVITNILDKILNPLDNTSATAKTSGEIDWFLVALYRKYDVDTFNNRLREYRKAIDDLQNDIQTVLKSLPNEETNYSKFYKKVVENVWRFLYKTLKITVIEGEDDVNFFKEKTRDFLEKDIINTAQEYHINIEYSKQDIKEIAFNITNYIFEESKDTVTFTQEEVKTKVAKMLTDFFTFKYKNKRKMVEEWNNRILNKIDEVNLVERYASPRLLNKIVNRFIRPIWKKAISSIHSVLDIDIDALAILAVKEISQSGAYTFKLSMYELLLKWAKDEFNNLYKNEEMFSAIQREVNRETNRKIKKLLIDIAKNIVDEKETKQRLDEILKYASFNNETSVRDELAREVYTKLKKSQEIYLKKGKTPEESRQAREDSDALYNSAVSEIRNRLHEITQQSSDLNTVTSIIWRAITNRVNKLLAPYVRQTGRILVTIQHPSFYFYNRQFDFEDYLRLSIDHVKAIVMGYYEDITSGSVQKAEHAREFILNILHSKGDSDKILSIVEKEGNRTYRINLFLICVEETAEKELAIKALQKYFQIEVEHFKNSLTKRDYSELGTDYLLKGFLREYQARKPYYSFCQESTPTQCYFLAPFPHESRKDSNIVAVITYSFLTSVMKKILNNIFSAEQENLGKELVKKGEELAKSLLKLSGNTITPVDDVAKAFNSTKASILSNGEAEVITNYEKIVFVRMDDVHVLNLWIT